MKKFWILFINGQIIEDLQSKYLFHDKENAIAKANELVISSGQSVVVMESVEVYNPKITVEKAQFEDVACDCRVYDFERSTIPSVIENQKLIKDSQAKFPGFDFILNRVFKQLDRCYLYSGYSIKGMSPEDMLLCCVGRDYPFGAKVSTSPDGSWQCKVFTG